MITVTEYTTAIEIKGIQDPWLEDVVMGVALSKNAVLTTYGYSLTHYDASAETNIDVLTDGYTCYRTTVTEVEESAE